MEMHPHNNNNNSGYMGPIWPCKMAKIKIVLRFITSLACPRIDMPPAQYQPLENTDQPKQDLVCLYGESRVVGSRLSEPTHFEDDIIEGDIAAIYGTQISTNNTLQSLSRSDSFDPGLYEALVQDFIGSMLNSVYYVEPQTPHRNRKIKALFMAVAFVAVLRKRSRIVPTAIYNPMENPSQHQEYLVQINGGPRVVGSGSSELNPFENNIIEGDMAAIYGQLSANYETNVLNEYISTDNIFQNPSRSDSFDHSLCEALVQGFIASILSSQYVGQQTPRRNRKMKALFKSVAFVAALRKRARITPPF